MSGRIWISNDMAESAAYNSLSGYAPQLLILVLGKRRFEKQGRKGKQKWVCTNIDSINITYSEFLKRGISKQRLTQAIDQLLAMGFISLIHSGGAYRHDKSIFALNVAPERNEPWRLWKPGTVFGARKKETVQRGFCKPKNKSRDDFRTLTRHEISCSKKILTA